VRIIVSPNQTIDPEGVNDGLMYEFSYLVSENDPTQIYINPSGEVDKGGKTYAKSITSEGAKVNISEKFTKAPTALYVPISSVVEVDPLTEITLNFVNEKAGPRSETTVYQDARYYRAFVYVDWSGTGAFTLVQTVGKRNGDAGFDKVLANYDEMMEFSVPLQVPASAAGRQCRVRVIYHNAWKDLEGPNAQNVNGQAYDITISVSGEASNDLEKSLRLSPEGEMFNSGLAWVKSVASSGAIVDVDYEYAANPGKFYSELPEMIVTEPGQKFTLNLKADTDNKISSGRDDLRYTYAEVYADFAGGHGQFKLLGRYGYDSNNSSYVKKSGNFRRVMDISVDVEVPTDASQGINYLRVIYNHVDKKLNSPMAKGLLGQAIDIPLADASVPNGIVEVTTDNNQPINGIYDLQGRKLTEITAPGIYIVNGKKIYAK
jgi:hypothetical protein